MQAVDINALETVTDFMSAAVKENEALTSKVAELQRHIGDQERIYLEKVAAAKQPAIPSTEIDRTLGLLVSMNILDQDTSTKIASEIQRDPVKLCGLLIKVAEAITTAPGEGGGVEKEGAEANSADPDGWHAFAEGKPVRVIR